MRDPIAMLQRTLDGASALVGSVKSGELAQPTPCEAWDVRALLNHMIGGNQLFASVLAGKQPPFDPMRPPDLVGSDPAAAYGAAATAVLAGWRAPGVLERTLNMPWGPTPAAVVIGFNFVDQLVHSWDLSKALGRGGPLDADLAEAALAFARQTARPEMRGPGKPIGNEVSCPANAPAPDRLAAFMGRQL